MLGVFDLLAVCQAFVSLKLTFNTWHIYNKPETNRRFVKGWLTDTPNISDWQIFDL